MMPSADDHEEQREISYIAGGNANGTAVLENSLVFIVNYIFTTIQKSHS